MPLYEYRCDGCGNQFEKLVRASAPAVACPGCGGSKLERQYSTFSAAVKNGASAQPCVPAPSGGCGAMGCGTGVCGRN